MKKAKFRKSASESKTHANTTNTTTFSYFACSSPAESSDWSYTPAYNTIKCKEYNWVGPYGAGEQISTSLTIGQAHNGIAISVDVAFIDSWDGEFFLVFADGDLVYSMRHVGAQSAFNDCQNSWTDAYSALTFGFNHSANTLNLVFTSNLDEDSTNEGWGICNLTITPNPGYVDVNGNSLGLGTGGTYKSITFECLDPQLDTDWWYDPYYNTASCASNNYLLYGSGGSIGTTLSINETHKGIIMSFYLALIDSWDGEYFILTADGIEVYKLQYTASSSTSSTAKNGWYDAYKVITVGFNHTGELLSLKFTSTLNEPLNNEAWGVCSVSITLSQSPVSSDGTVLSVNTKSDNKISNELIFSCSAPENDTAWSYSPAYQTVNCSGNTYVGGYGKNGEIRSVFSIPDQHNGIVLSFKLALIDSWDSESFVVYADDAIVYSLSAEYHAFTSDTCQNSWGDAYYNVTVGFNHTASELDLVFTSTLDQVSTDEAWGICDLNITIYTHYVDVNGNKVGSGTGGTIDGVKFSCDSPAVDTDWSYDPYYQVINCSGNYYLGGYGRGGSVSAVLSVPETHEGIVISFNLAVIDSWDSESFYVTVDGKTLYFSWFAYEKATTNSCQNGWNDGYQNVTLGLNHTGNYITIKFSSNLDQDESDEAWGICDLKITASSTPVDSEGNAL